MKFSVELGDSPALYANKKIGAKLEPIKIKHILPNQEIARSVVTNGYTTLCLENALYKSQLPRKITRRPDSQAPNPRNITWRLTSSVRTRHR